MATCRLGTRLHRILAFCLAAIMAALTGMAHAGSDRHDHHGWKGPGPLILKKEGNFSVGGEYNARNRMVGQMYVESSIPKHRKYKYPIILVHGGGQIGSGWNETPDGREGWTQYFLRRGFAVYVV